MDLHRITLVRHDRTDRNEEMGEDELTLQPCCKEGSDEFGWQQLQSQYKLIALWPVSMQQDSKFQKEHSNYFTVK